MKGRSDFVVIEGSKTAPLPVRRDILLGATTFAATFVVVLTALLWPAPPPNSPVHASPSIAMTVTRPNIRVIDGDTIEERTSGVIYRLANVDTPETGDRARCTAERQLGNQAKSAARSLVGGAQSLEILPSGRVDKYGRTIAYVKVDGQDLGVILIARNLARQWSGRREPWCDASGRLIR